MLSCHFCIVVLFPRFGCLHWAVVGALVVLLGQLASGGFKMTLNGGDVVARWMWVVIGRSVEFVGNVVEVVVVG